jgi:hypothetical protein
VQVGGRVVAVSGEPLGTGAGRGPLAVGTGPLEHPEQGLAALGVERPQLGAVTQRDVLGREELRDGIVRVGGEPLAAEGRSEVRGTAQLLPERDLVRRRGGRREAQHHHRRVTGLVGRAPVVAHVPGVVVVQPQ